MSELLTHRCLQHPDREAVARCPECRQFFCRECVTEHDERVVCAACLRKQSVPRAERRRWLAGVGRALAAGLGFVAGWLLFYSAGQMLLSIPSEFHEGTVWKINFWDSK